MPYNPDIHHRRSIRLKDYDYSQAGAYFFTIKTQNRAQLFGTIAEGQMALSPAGEMVLRVWEQLPERFEDWDLDDFVIMPNHVHGILVVGAAEGDYKNRPYDDDHIVFGDLRRGEPRVRPNLPDNQLARPEGTEDGSLGRVIQAFKSLTTFEYTKGVKQLGWPPFDRKVWQTNYHERIIRDEAELNFKREYIINNPLKWETDEENPTRTA